MGNLELLGYVSASFLAICSIPQAWKSYKDGRTEGIAHSFLWLWFLGEIGTLIYTILKLGWVGPLILNYVFNILLIGVIMRYLYFPRGKS